LAGVGRGDVWLARLDKVRPVVILHRDAVADRLHQLLVAPLTTTARGIPTEVDLDPATDPVARPCVVNADQVTSLRREELVRQVGVLGDKRMSEICAALAVATGCDR
jgi:mRNA interferase MazF